MTEMPNCVHPTNKHTTRRISLVGEPAQHGLAQPGDMTEKNWDHLVSACHRRACQGVPLDLATNLQCLNLILIQVASLSS